MNQEERMAKVVAIVDVTRQDISRLHDAVESLRLHTDRGFADLRAGMDAQRKELITNVRWIIGTILAITAMVAGILAKVIALN